MQLKPQDFLVSLKLLLLQKRSERVTYAQLAQSTGLAVSETHTAVKRAAEARLLIKVLLESSDQPTAIPKHRANATTITEFALHGMKYVWPGVEGPRRRGVATGLGFVADALGMVHRGENHVWPSVLGETEGIALEPWHPALPVAAGQDAALHECLAILEVLRTKFSRAMTEAERVLRLRLNAPTWNPRKAPFQNQFAIS